MYDPLPWDSIKYQIDCLKKPVPFAWKYSEISAHIMVIVGYIEHGDEQLLLRNNPIPCSTGSQDTITYDAYISGNTYSHLKDYYNITKNK